MRLFFATRHLLFCSFLVCLRSERVPLVSTGTTISDCLEVRCSARRVAYSYFVRTDISTLLSALTIPAQQQQVVVDFAVSHLLKTELSNGTQTGVKKTNGWPSTGGGWSS